MTVVMPCYCIGRWYASADVIAIRLSKLWCQKRKLQDTHLLIHFDVYIKLLKLTFSSDLRKPCCKLVNACLSIKNLFCF